MERTNVEQLLASNPTSLLVSAVIPLTCRVAGNTKMAVLVALRLECSPMRNSRFAGSLSTFTVNE
jgi:hypothetical protein